MPLDVGIELGQEGVQVIGIPRLDGALDGLHVLLRHRPPSIPRATVLRVTIRVNPPGTRGARVPTLLVKLIGKLQTRTFRRRGEQRVSKSAGFPVVLLTTRGAKTGRTRTAPVGGFPDGENSWLVAATLGGAAHHPAWFLNMAKHPDDIWLEVGTERFKVRGDSLEGAGAR